MTKRGLIKGGDQGLFHWEILNRDSQSRELGMWGSFQVTFPIPIPTNQPGDHTPMPSMQQWGLVGMRN